MAKNVHQIGSVNFLNAIENLVGNEEVKVEFINDTGNIECIDLVRLERGRVVEAFDFAGDEPEFENPMSGSYPDFMLEAAGRPLKSYLEITANRGAHPNIARARLWWGTWEGEPKAEVEFA